MTDPDPVADAVGVLISWLRSIAIAVLGCAVAIALLVGLILYGLWRVSVSVDNQGDVLAGQERAQSVSACAQEYTATYRAWFAESNRRFGELISYASAAPDDAEVPPEMIDQYTDASANADEMTRRSLGLSELAEPGQDFECPPIPRRLRVEPVDPTDP